MTNGITGLPSPDLFVSIVFLISSCEQVCHVSSFISVLEGRLRIQVMNEMMMQSKNSKGTVLIYCMMIKKKELADVILVNICFREL